MDHHRNTTSNGEGRGREIVVGTSAEDRGEEMTTHGQGTADVGLVAVFLGVDEELGNVRHLLCVHVCMCACVCRTKRGVIDLVSGLPPCPYAILLIVVHDGACRCEVCVCGGGRGVVRGGIVRCCAYGRERVCVPSLRCCSRPE